MINLKDLQQKSPAVRKVGVNKKLKQYKQLWVSKEEVDTIIKALTGQLMKLKSFNNKDAPKFKI